MKREEQRNQMARKHAGAYNLRGLPMTVLALKNAYNQGWKDADDNPNWISVDDQLPEKDGRYLFYDEILGPQVSAYYNGCTLVPSVTHWMPLPQPPKTEKGGGE